MDDFVSEILSYVTCKGILFVFCFFKFYFTLPSIHSEAFVEGLLNQASGGVEPLRQNTLPAQKSSFCVVARLRGAVEWIQEGWVGGALTGCGDLGLGGGAAQVKGGSGRDQSKSLELQRTW